MNLESHIDHTLLRPDATTENIQQLCSEAIKYQFKAICINPCFLETAKVLLDGTSVKLCTVIGFPLGAMTTAAKVYEAKDSIMKGGRRDRYGNPL